jgi:hypothetical protein
VSVREDIERITSGIHAVQAEVDPWLDRLAAGQLSQAEFDNQTKAAQDRLESLELELNLLRSHPGDVPAADLDLLIADVESNLVAARRRHRLLSATIFAEVPAGAAHLIVTEQIRTLDHTLARLKTQRDERARFTVRVLDLLERAVEDRVIDGRTMDRLRGYL